nr:PREDICTED: little elongation complex subunit 2-like isoform X7 [Megachile rotundata]
MERFVNIDWNPPLEDMLDNVFINEARLEKESVMYRIMNGNFTDPFKNADEDYKNVKINFIKNIDPELNEENKDNEIATSETKKENQSKQKKNVRCYVPGIVKPIFKFPKKSKLNTVQHAMCLRVLLRFSETGKPKLTQTEKEELHNYLDLQQIISQEQDEFLEFAKSKWQERLFKITCEDYINLCWKSKLQYIYKLPRYYSEVTNVPFIANKNTEVKFISLCLQMGELPEIILPSFIKPYMLRVSSDQLQRRFRPKKNICSESSVSFKLPVSEDPNCQKLADNNNVDLVISSSGLNCLVNNVDSSYSNSWILPLTIKRHNDKNVIYIDKSPPPVASNISEKNNWVYKYILRYFLIPRKHQTSENIEGYEDNIFSNINSEELLKLEAEYENTLTQVDNISDSTILKKDNIEDTINQPNFRNDIDSTRNTLNSDTCSNIAVDCNASSFTRNNQVRISAITSEVLQVEYRTAMSISNEIKRLYNIKVESSLTIIHNIIQYLQNLAPGRYILRHTVRNGAFATVYKETDSPGKNTFDLHTIYGKEFYNLPNSAWIPLDKTIPTPMHKCFERMPAMFFPSNYKTFNKNQKASEINKANIACSVYEVRSLSSEIVSAVTKRMTRLTYAHRT